MTESLALDHRSVHVEAGSPMALTSDFTCEILPPFPHEFGRINLALDQAKVGQHYRPDFGGEGEPGNFKMRCSF